MKPRELAALLKSRSAPVVLDVRSRAEYAAGHIPGAVHVPFWAILVKRNQLSCGRGSNVVITCEHGPRAELARGQLALLGYRSVSLLEGHMSRWRRLGLPVTKKP